jgi:MYXO-CTERM domain-containing protein
MRSIRTAALVLSAIAATAGTASAEIVTVFCPGVGAGRSVAVTHMGSGRTVFAGQILLTLTNSSSGSLNGNWKSFCTELSQYIYVNGAAQVYNVVPVSDLPNPGNGMGQVRADAIARMYSFANGAQFNASNADYAAAFQIAVWEISNDYTGTSASIDLAAGNLQAAGLATAIANPLATLFAAAANTGGAQSQLVGLGNASYQDQIIDPTQAIPTPGAVAMLGLAGLAGLGGRRRRR